MSDTEIVQNLMARLQAGDNSAATAVYQRFASRLIGLAREKLDLRIRQKVDPEDVVQSVFKSFFRRHGDGEYDLHNVESLWGLLSLITLRKCGQKIGYYYAACRNVSRETNPRPMDGEASQFWTVISDEPAPSHALRLAETLEQIMRPLDRRKREILTLSLRGYGTAEISAQVPCSDRTVRRVLEDVRKQLEQMRDGE